MNITDEIIDYVSKLSKLEMTPEEKERQKTDMQNVVNYVEIIHLLDNKEVEATSHTCPITNVFREDKIKSSFNRRDILSNANEKKDGYYKIPRAVE